MAKPSTTPTQPPQQCSRFILENQTTLVQTCAQLDSGIGWFLTNSVLI